MTTHSHAHCEHSISIPSGPFALQGDFTIPNNARGMVLFAHGSGSSRLSPRNRSVAGRLNRSGLATLLFDLLSEQEAEDRDNIFDIQLLADRLSAATAWATSLPALHGLPVGYFGASTGAAAALVAASGRRDIKAVVSRGGRPDLAEHWLRRVTAPTLLIVGEDDADVLNLNRWALERLRCRKRLEVVPGATHLFEQPGALDRVAELAETWFLDCLAPDGDA